MNSRLDEESYTFHFDDDFLNMFDGIFGRRTRDTKETKSHDSNIIDLYEQADGKFAIPLEIEG